MSPISFSLITLASLKMFLMGAAGYGLYKAKFLSGPLVDGLNTLIIWLFLPCFILSEFLGKFRFADYPLWWIYPLLGIGISLAGLLAGRVFSFALARKDIKREFLALCAFQNSGYVPLLIVQVILGPEVVGTMYMLIFLFLTGFNFLVFSLGAVLIAGAGGTRLRFQDIFNPPLAATVIGLLMVFCGVNRLIPAFVMDTLGAFGACMMPMAILVVGGALAAIKLDSTIYRREVLLAILVKLVVFPTLALLLAFVAGLRSLTGLLLVLEAAAPSAVTLVVLARYYKKPDHFINQTIFYTHLIGLVTIPIFLMAYQRLLGGP